MWTRRSLHASSRGNISWSIRRTWGSRRTRKFLLPFGNGPAFMNFSCQRVPSLLQFSNAALRPPPQSPHVFSRICRHLSVSHRILQRGPSLTQSIVTWDRSHPAAPMASITLCQVAPAVCGPRLLRQHILHCSASGSLMLCSPPLRRGGISQLRILRQARFRHRSGSTSNRCSHRSGFTIAQGSPFTGIIRQARCRHRSGFTIARCKHRSGFTIVQGSPFTGIIRIIRPSSVRRR